MSFVNRMLASVGIGAAKVDTVLDKDTYSPGENVTGTVKIYGGKVEQEIDHITLFVMTEYYREVDDNKVRETTALAKYTAASKIKVAANENKDIPFSFALPAETPYTIGQTPVWIKTGLDIQMAVDPTDNDFIKVLPDASASAVFSAVEHIGFKLRKANCELAPRFLRSSVPFIQEFEFVPMSGAFYRKLDELEVIMLRQGTGIELLLEIDKKAKGLFGMLESAMDMDERKVRVSLTGAQLQNPQVLGRELEQLIQRYI
ncbi:sporulation protein [Fictibacillus iocasae]|uniref:Sporulation protein n=1 Tax=Fictibacillus iocasae TaxID=2715437 RepID=A0ABW2NQU8_9BACL